MTWLLLEESYWFIVSVYSASIQLCYLNRWNGLHEAWTAETEFTDPTWAKKSLRTVSFSFQKVLQALTESPGNVKRFPAPAAQPHRTASHWNNQAEAAPLNWPTFNLLRFPHPAAAWEQCGLLPSSKRRCRMGQSGQGAVTTVEEMLALRNWRKHLDPSLVMFWKRNERGSLLI